MTQGAGELAEARVLTPIGASPAPAPEEPLQELEVDGEAGVQRGRKAKRVRLLLDARTELTDEEMKV